jgi:hypothetical protein
MSQSAWDPRVMTLGMSGPFPPLSPPQNNSGKEPYPPERADLGLMRTTTALVCRCPLFSQTFKRGKVPNSQKRLPNKLRLRSTYYLLSAEYRQGTPGRKYVEKKESKPSLRYDRPTWSNAFMLDFLCQCRRWTSSYTAACRPAKRNGDVVVFVEAAVVAITLGTWSL